MTVNVVLHDHLLMGLVWHLPRRLVFHFIVVAGCFSSHAIETPFFF